MTLDEIEAGKHGEHLHKVINTLAKSTWGMSVAQLAQSARLSVKTVHKVLKDNPTHFNDKEGVYTLRGQKEGVYTLRGQKVVPKPEKKEKPSTQSVSIPGIDASAEISAHFETKSNHTGPEVLDDVPALTSILGIPLVPVLESEKAVATDDGIGRDQVILDEMLAVINKQPAGILSRELMMVLNIRRDQVYKFADILIAQNKIHRIARTNRQIKYKCGPSPVPVLEHNDFSDMVKTTVIQKREVTLTQEEVEQVLLRVFSMDKIKFISTAKGIAVAMVAEVEY